MAVAVQPTIFGKFCAVLILGSIDLIFGHQNQALAIDYPKHHHLAVVEHWRSQRSMATQFLGFHKVTGKMGYKPRPSRTASYF
jgi:hypothetical protein